MLRTVTCGQLRITDVNKEVTLCGWVNRVRNLGSLCFVDLRDTYGITQLNIDPKFLETTPLHSEDCIQVTGTVIKKDEPNKHLETGEIEILVKSIKVFSHAETTPFTITDDTTASEETRMKYRYLDLRRPVMQKYLKKRHQILKVVRNYLEGLNFNEICTPTLIKSTPEGARDYLVPSRIYKGSFYALPQSPQIFKQLLMISGMDKYYQIALCYRDEDQRADRQPEFVQIDCEMSFSDREDVLQVIEGLLKSVWKEVLNVELPDFIRLPYQVCINNYGSDKPDLRFGMRIEDVTAIFANTTFEAYKEKAVRGFKVSNYADKLSRKMMDADNELVKKNKVYGVTHLKYVDNQFSGGISKFLSDEEKEALVAKYELANNDVLILGADASGEKMSLALGVLRLHYGDLLNLRPKDKFVPLFVIDWPMFERNSEGQIECLSNPFTRPNDEDLHLFDTDPTQIRTYGYDTVMNGVELSSGALRTYDSKIQEKVFKLLGLSDEQIKDRFGFFIDSLKYGTPPMGGFGIGLERLCMVLCETDNVRDVIAFPKNLSAYDPMTQAPSKVDVENIDILGLEVKKEFR